MSRRQSGRKRHRKMQVIRRAVKRVMSELEVKNRPIGSTNWTPRMQRLEKLANKLAELGDDSVLRHIIITKIMES